MFIGHFLRNKGHEIEEKVPTWEKMGPAMQSFR